MDHLLPWVGFSAFPGIGPVRFSLLVEYFGSPTLAWNASYTKLCMVGLSGKLVESFCRFRESFDWKAYKDRLASLGITIVPRDAVEYPVLLRSISDAPIVLYVRGNVDAMRRTYKVGIVGTRRMTPYGKSMAESISSGLVRSGVTIVSGMAYGIDAIAHDAALTAFGTTIAVLGCGVDVVAPEGNRWLYEKILSNESGAIVSEMPLSFRPTKGVFPARNRIISGMSLGVVVVEGTEKSGSLITARYAAEQGREVFAVPGAATSCMSQGPIQLLRNGATVCTSSNDICGILDIPSTGVIDIAPAANISKKEFEARIVSLLQRSPMGIDELVSLTHLTAQEVAVTLTVLEMQGKVRDYGENVYTAVEK